MNSLRFGIDRYSITTHATRGNSVVKQSSTYLSECGKICKILANGHNALPNGIVIFISHYFRIEFRDVFFSGITSGRGYAHGEVGIAYLDIESVCV